MIINKFDGSEATFLAALPVYLSFLAFLRVRSFVHFCFIRAGVATTIIPDSDVNMFADDLA